MTGADNLFIYWPVRHSLGQRRKIQQIYPLGNGPGCISPGHLDRVFWFMKLCWKALQRSAVSEQQSKKTSRATAYTRLFLILLISLAMIEKRSKRRLKKQTFIIVKNIILAKNWFVVSNFWKLPTDHTGKRCSGHLYFLLQIKVKLATIRLL